ncbi:leucine-rich repeat domain-containing protein [Leptospira noguchii]|uniref:leucine-rich repeat domain-containing protein n=1 Tax=Leptospira noguchii TaxID=28182 RepID=UPI001FB70627|nr:leucine-rich repeat domain-containing protein [Leptospira noguchii]UOG51018.1 leucine-rich repeat domain-containing protein [Leptospira noguchii]
MNFRITLIHLQKITINLLILIYLSCKTQKTYFDLTEAIQNPLDVRVLNLSIRKLKTLPNEIGQLKNLRELNLSYNQFTTLPNETGQLKNLQFLDLSDNQLKTLPNEIGQLKNLQSLYLINNQLSSEEKERIRKLLPKCKIYFE